VSNDQNELEQAADWQIRLQEDPQSRGAFEQWLAQSESHRLAWRKME
jgi:transmembrane sensor